MTTFTVTQGLAGREFLALGGFLAAFGIPDPERGGELYIREDQLRHMEVSAYFALHDSHRCHASALHKG